MESLELTKLEEDLLVAHGLRQHKITGYGRHYTVVVGIDDYRAPVVGNDRWVTKRNRNGETYEEMEPVYTLQDPLAITHGVKKSPLIIELLRKNYKNKFIFPGEWWKKEGEIYINKNNVKKRIFDRFNLIPIHLARIFKDGTRKIIIKYMEDPHETYDEDLESKNLSITQFLT